MQEIFLGRQPILDRNQDLVAYELLFRSGHTTNAQIIGDFPATASVIVNAYAELGIQTVLGRQRGFINVNAELLMSDMIHVLPKSQVVLELVETVEVNETVVRRCSELRNMGYQLALDDVTEITDQLKPLLPIVNVVKVDLPRLDPEALAHTVNSLRAWPLLLVAEKVDSAEQAGRCMALGFDLFQGYYFARPQIMTGKRADPSKLGLLRLLGLILDDDTTETEIEQEFKHHPNLSYNLMRMVNSVASGRPQKISSLKHGIIVLGRKHLQRWMQLLLYTVDRDDSHMVSALMQMAATRGKLMELLAAMERPHDKDYQDRAFMAGILSLLDTLLSLPLPQIVGELSLADEVKSALLVRGGHLGRLLTLLEKNECNDVGAVSAMLAELGFLSLTELAVAELTAMGWAGQLGESAH